MDYLTTTPCPCCNFLTKEFANDFEICPICFWQDDGQNDMDSDKIKGGPNKDYSLTEARQNFQRNYTMFRPSDKELFNYTREKKNKNGKVVLNKVSIKKKVIRIFAELQEASSPDTQLSLSKDIDKLIKKL